jgi:hypothetical protein
MWSLKLMQPVSAGRLLLFSVVLLITPTFVFAASASPACPKIMEFSGEQRANDAKDPALDGRVLLFYWSQLEPQQEVFDFSALDAQAKVWSTAGKSIAIRVSTAGWKKWMPPYSQSGTPAWVYQKYHLRSVTEIDGAVIPVYWDPGYVEAFGAFLHQLDTHLLGAPYRSSITFIEIGIGDGGETKPDTEQNKDKDQQAARLALWLSVGYTGSTWFTTIENITKTYQKQLGNFPLALMPDGTFLGGTCGLADGVKCNEAIIVALANSEGLLLQDNGFLRDRTYSPEWLKKRPLIAEQRNAAQANGYPLKDDLNRARSLGVDWLLLFQKDLDVPEFKQQLVDFRAGCRTN